MKKHIKIDYSKALSFINEEEIAKVGEEIKEAHNALHNGTGLGNDFLGWVELPNNYDKEEFARIEKAAIKIRSNSDVLLVIGIGGSYLGAKAALEMLNNPFKKEKDLEVIFVGHHISSTYMMDLMDYIDGNLVSGHRFLWANLLICASLCCRGTVITFTSARIMECCAVRARRGYGTQGRVPATI